MRPAQDLPVVLRNARDPSAPALTLGGPVTVLVNAAPQWFGLRGDDGLAISDVRVRVGERGVAEVIASGALALAPLALRLPARDTAATYLSWAATLAGTPKAASKELATRFGISAFFEKPLTSVPPHVRRAVAIASAYLSGASTLVLEDPLDGLPVDVAEEFTRVLIAALAGRRILWLAARIDAASALASACDEVLWFHGGACVHRGQAAVTAESDTCILSLRGPAGAFTDRLTADGVAATAVSSDADTSIWTVRTQETWRIFSAASDVGATITELRMLAKSVPRSDI